MYQYLKNITSILTILSLFLGVFGINSASAENTITAASCSQSDVQAAVDQAVSGDTVMIPSGICTWTTTLVISLKNITLKGSGIDNTMITAAPNFLIIYLNLNSSQVSDLTVSCGRISVNGDNWRIHHNKFTCNQFLTGVEVRGIRKQNNPYGLIDHNQFINMRALVQGYPAVTLTELAGSTQWSEPLNLGTEKSVYVEDNTFNFDVFGNAMDCNYAGKYVFRHNTLNDVYIEAHSIQGTHRSCRSWEIYENNINQISRSLFSPFFLRGGTGVVFNNTITGNYGIPKIIVDNIRSFEAKGDGGLCDGDSSWDGNVESNGYPCRDQIGRSTDSGPWPSPGGPYPSQSLDPMYVWNNMRGTTEIPVLVHNCPGGLGSCQHIKENRDYYNNQVKPGYTPYTYPHPLVSGATTTALSGDINLDHIVNTTDFSIMNSKWLSLDASSDLNHDGIVNALDFSILNGNWLKTW